MNNRALVDRIVTTSQFDKVVKKLDKDHRNIEKRKLNEIINKLKRFEISSGNSNHSVGNSINDLHITSNLVLLYRYNGNILMLELELNNLSDHDNLSYNISRADKLKKSHVITATDEDQDIVKIISEEFNNQQDEDDLESWNNII